MVDSSYGTSLLVFNSNQEIIAVYILVNESDPRSNVHYLGSSENKALKKFRPVRDLNPWPLRYRCSALPTELTSQLGAGHDVGSK